MRPCNVTQQRDDAYSLTQTNRMRFVDKQNFRLQPTRKA